MVFDPKIELVAEFDQSWGAGQEVIKDVYETSPHEVLEVYRMEIVPPNDGSVIKKLKKVTLMENDKELSSVAANSVMLPPEYPTMPSKAVDLGVPILWSRLMGRVPTPIENTTFKVAEGSVLSVKVVAEEAFNEPFKIRLLAARVKGQSDLVAQAGASYTVSFALDSDVYSKSPINIAPNTFNELPGGLAQKKPQIFPWITYARNKNATTVNEWYDFKWRENVTDQFQNLSWNLVEKSEAYLVNYLGVQPHTNSKSLRFYIVGRETNPEYNVRPLPEENFFFPALTYSVSTNAGLKWAGPAKVDPPRLFHGVKGGIQIKDNGTSIPANGIEVEVYGVKFVLR